MKLKTEVRCDGTMLTAAFHDASPPVLWRYDVVHNPSFSMALTDRDGRLELSVETSDGKTAVIARFDDAKAAARAFAKVERAMPQNKSLGVLIVKSVLIFMIVAVIVLGAVGTYIINARSAPPSLASINEAPAQPGMPESADTITPPPLQ